MGNILVPKLILKSLNFVSKILKDKSVKLWIIKSKISSYV